MKIKYEGKEYGERKVINNIKREYKRSDTPSNFYEAANEWCRQFRDIELIRSVAILAALSPLKSWELNKSLAKKTIETGVVSGHTERQLYKVRAIVAEEYLNIDSALKILNGEKTKNFFLNILEYKTSENVTIDRHSVAIATNRKVYTGASKSAYQFFERCYKKAASELRVTPLVLQATTWTSWRERK